MADLSLRADSVRYNPDLIPGAFAVRGFNDGLETDPTPIELPAVLAYIVGAKVATRRTVEQLIEAAIAELDALDGDLDLEDGHDREASDGDDRDIAWPNWNPNNPVYPLAVGGCIGGDLPTEDDEDTHDRENVYW